MIVFLDFDGVLHPARPASDDSSASLFCRLPLFEMWLRERPGIEVVISSTWRQSRSRDEIVGYFAEDLRSRIVGSTPVLNRAAWNEFCGEQPPLRFPRELEVLQWLAASPEPWREWVALDDQPHLFRPFNTRLVVCDADVGLTSSELTKLDELLRIAR